LGEPLPKKVFGHGCFAGRLKDDHIQGNVVDPALLAGRYGVDA
jgi:hypothetical protein